MDSVKARRFVEKLSFNTAQSLIDWNRATDFAGLDYESRPELGDVFFQTEWHKISFLDSFFAHIDTGFIYLVDTTNESGRDGSISHVLEFYIENNENQIFRVPVPQSLLYQLSNAINSYIAKKEAPIDSFIDSYLNS